MAKQPPTVMVLGKSGAGKSTLSNYFLYNSPRHDDGFKAGKGGTPVTVKCEAKSVEETPAPVGTGKPCGPLTMIDTPGIPDPRGRTPEFYDEIVLTMRRIGGLNALVFLINYCDDRAQVLEDFKTHRILLEQFNGLVCPTVFICRFSSNPDLQDSEKEVERETVQKWVKLLMAEVKLETSCLILVNQSEPQREPLFKARQNLAELPFTPITEMNIRTWDKVGKSMRRLVDGDTRREELEEKKRILTTLKEQGRGYCNDLQILSKEDDAPKDAPMPGGFWGAICDFFKSLYLLIELLLALWEKKEADIDGQLQIVQRELDGDDNVKVMALERDVNALRELEKLDQMFGIPNVDSGEIVEPQELGVAGECALRADIPEQIQKLASAVS